MLFKRRDAEPLPKKIGNLIWPKMGFRRVLDYYKHRSIRIPASDHSIAAGLAFGCLVSWTPLFGTHLIQCLLFCWLTRTNVIAAFIGTAFGNLLTTPFLMLVAYHVGKFILSMLGFDVGIHHVDPTMGMTEEAFERPKIFLPTLVGGYTVGILTFPLFYYPFYYMVKGARAARRNRIEQKIHKEAQEVTGQME
jgi:uncharacterized protein (DUF2062 family)